jgi:lysozyme family protein
MSASSFDAALARVLAHEGGYSNHPSDPGGVTLEGVTQAVYDDDRRSKGLPREALLASMRGTPAWIAARNDIYRARYWDALRCDDLPPGVDYAVFDYGVNSGVGRSGKVLRRVLDLADGASVVSDAVVRAAQVADAGALVAAICDERLVFLKSLKTWPVFGAGWSRRVADVRRDALAMTSGAAATRTTNATTAATAGIVLAAGATAAAGRMWILFVVAIAVAAVFAIGGWLVWRRHQQQSQERA